MGLSFGPVLWLKIQRGEIAWSRHRAHTSCSRIENPRIQILCGLEDRAQGLPCVSSTAKYTLGSSSDSRELHTNSPDSSRAKVTHMCKHIRTLLTGGCQMVVVLFLSCPFLSSVRQVRPIPTCALHT